MKYIIEVLDERDKDKVDKWSHFGVCYDSLEFQNLLGELESYIREFPIIEVRIRIER